MLNCELTYQSFSFTARLSSECLEAAAEKKELMEWKSGDPVREVRPV